MSGFDTRGVRIAPKKIEGLDVDHLQKWGTKYTYFFLKNNFSLIWHRKHRNAVIFDHRQPSTDDLFSTIQDEVHAWAKAGAKGIQALFDVM